MTHENDWLLQRPNKQSPASPGDNGPDWPTTGYVTTGNATSIDQPQVRIGPDPRYPDPWADRRPAPKATKAEATGNNWLTIILACLVAFFIFREIRDRGIVPGPTPDDGQVVDIDGTHALILVDEDAQDQLSPGQAAAANWSGIIPYATERGIGVRKYDIDDDLAAVEPVFRTLRQNAAPPPSITILRDNRVTTAPLPDGIDALKSALGP